ncbi:hypothetical protein RHMOL_Rhmol05G0005500 [Rhododendron molle]|uniref:Uncharacterized protein n=1 Tax=Rhododendron molle TaxID=49168 RepID=A0ACC0NJE5_RHOML|nr:hypothetical protein RHMOL_Rhmol05G0005500 [Rhododendron molle]
MLWKNAALENPLIEDSMMILTLESGLALLILVGVEHVGIPESESAQNVRGLMVEVYWEQDSNGNLCISSHSVEIPISDDVDCTLPSSLLKEAEMRKTQQPGPFSHLPDHRRCNLGSGVMVNSVLGFGYKWNFGSISDNQIKECSNVNAEKVE